jgi:hypothetical protein
MQATSRPKRAQGVLVSSKSLSDRRQALEDRFFKDEEAKKISRLRDELDAKKQSEELRRVSGIDNDKVLSALVTLNVGAGDLHALSLVPLVKVAWANGTVEDKERTAVLEAAHTQGVSEGTHGYQLLESWLSSRPGDDLFEAWSSYVESLVSELNDEDRIALQESILGLAHDVASAAGGILGLGSVSSAEQAALKAIGDAFNK